MLPIAERCAHARRRVCLWQILFYENLAQRVKKAMFADYRFNMAPLPEKNCFVEAPGVKAL